MSINDIYEMFKINPEEIKHDKEYEEECAQEGLFVCFGEYRGEEISIIDRGDFFIVSFLGKRDQKVDKATGKIEPYRVLVH